MVGVWSSNPHAPSISINNLAQLTAFSPYAKLRHLKVDCCHRLVSLAAAQTLIWISTLEHELRS